MLPRGVKRKRGFEGGLISPSELRTFQAKREGGLSPRPVPHGRHCVLHRRRQPPGRQRGRRSPSPRTVTVPTTESSESHSSARDWPEAGHRVGTPRPPLWYRQLRRRIGQGRPACCLGVQSQCLPSLQSTLHGCWSPAHAGCICKAPVPHRRAHWRVGTSDMHVNGEGFCVNALSSSPPSLHRPDARAHPTPPLSLGSYEYVCIVRAS